MINPICIKKTSAVAMITNTVLMDLSVSGSMEKAGALIAPIKKEDAQKIRRSLRNFDMIPPMAFYNLKT
jgi:hypothetical protein